MSSCRLKNLSPYNFHDFRSKREKLQPALTESAAFIFFKLSQIRLYHMKNDAKIIWN